MKTVGVAFAETVAVLFPIVEPIGCVPTFMTLTADVEREARKRLVTRVTLLVVGALTLFALLGEPLLHVFGISLEALQIGGGLIVAYTGFRMITATEAFVEEGARSGDVAFAPLTIPLLAGPGAMAALLGLESREEDVWLSMPGTIAGIAVIGLSIFVLFRLGERVSRVIGPGGFAALTTIMGLIVLSIGVEMVVHGIVEHGAVVGVD